MKIQTYFAPCNGMNPREQSTLLDIWRRAWKSAGWEPVILTQRDAKVHPDYVALTEKFRAFPTVNNPDYELACWHRWLAMAIVGGVMSDYDVLPFGFTPEMLPLNDSPLASILMDNNPCPCIVHGTAQQFDNSIRMMADYKAGAHDVAHGDRPHVSDQSAVQGMSENFRPHIYNMCLEYRSREWKSSPLVHYCHGATAGFDRAELMRQGARGVRE